MVPTKKFMLNTVKNLLFHTMLVKPYTRDMSSLQNKFFYLHFYFNDFTVDKFIEEIIKNFKLNTTYTIIFKISCNNHELFKMCGPQIGLTIHKEHDVDYYKKLFDLIMIRIDTTTQEYSEIITRIDTFEIMYSTSNLPIELKMKDISNINIPQNIVSANEAKKDFSYKLLPLTMDTSYYGYPVLTDKKFEYLNLINSNNYPVHTKQGIIIKDSDKMFVYQPANSKNEFLIVSQELDVNTFLRFIYDLKTGIYIKTIKDQNLSNEDSIVKFERTIGSINITITNNKVTLVKINNDLSPIMPRSEKYVKLDRNLNFGTFDLETFMDSDGLAKVYAAGFLTNLDEKPQLFYLTDFLTESQEFDSESLLLTCIDSMLINKYNKFIFYVHNFSKFDVVFLYNVLLKANQVKGFDYYNLKPVLRDNNIIKLTVKIKLNNNSKNFIKITFVDSLNLLNNTLKKLALDFNVEHKKGFFPYNFVSKNNLNYIGNKPDKFFFEQISDLEYDLIENKDWNLKLNCLTYLESDLRSLLDVMNEFSSKLFINFNTQMTNALTITRVAFNIFFDSFYKIKQIPLINKSYLFNFIKEAYYGGVTEVYRPHGLKLVGLDVNSIYPKESLKPLPGLKCEYVESLEEEGLNLDELFGFFLARVKTNDQYIGLLPIHDNETLICPNGEFLGIWSSEELKFAKEHGYLVTVIKGYNFNKIPSVFKDYVLNLYDIKSKATGSLRSISKSLLNNLIGRFGLNWLKPVTDIVTETKRDYIAATRTINSHKVISGNRYLLTYNPSISKKICEEHNLDFIKVLDKESKKNLEKHLDIFKDVSIAITAMVTSYARIFMNIIKLIIINNGGLLYYTDTDSLVIDINSLHLISQFIGNDLGQFKIEHYIEEGFFISNKTYCLVLDNGKIIIKSKGVINTKLTLEDFKNMYFKQQNVIAIKNDTKTLFDKGSVIISTKPVNLNQDVYKKREKIFNNEGLWVDTKPLTFNNIKNT